MSSLRTKTSQKEQESGPYAKRFRVTVYLDHGTEKKLDLTFRSLPVATATFQREAAYYLIDGGATVLLSLDRNDTDRVVNAGTTLAAKYTNALYVEFFAAYYRLLIATQ